ncbi:MAG TPA: ABC transporter permease [Acidimicrobiales bacterium]|nr:ABC transporter permease [Acidimicrobiales bacterium]
MTVATPLAEVPSWVRGAVPAAAGLVAVVAGTAGLSSGGAMWLRVVLTLAGAGVLYRAYRALAAWAKGPEWPAAYWAAVTWLGLIGVGALVAPLLPLGEESNASRTLDVVPLLRPDLGRTFPLGTNAYGLDLLARVLEGARVSLVVSLGGVAIGIVVGGTIGLVTGYLRGPVDSAVRVVADTVLAFPPLILLLAVASVAPRTSLTFVLAFGFLLVPINIRLARGNTLAVVQREFVLSAESLGASPRRIVFRELLPNVVLPSVSYGLVLVPLMIVTEAALSFLGLGIPPPRPSWGNMIAEGRAGASVDNPHLVLVPGCVLILTVLALNRVAERLRHGGLGER